LRAALQRREPDAQCETKAGRLLVELSTAGLPLLPTPNSAAACRETVLAAVMERTQLEHQTIPLLHLQCRALLKDKKLLRDPTLLESDEGTSRGGSLSRSLSIAGSEDSNTLTRPSSSNSDTKSAVSISGSRKLPKLQHISLNDKLEYWIALKGLVFRISFDKCPAGRSAYYRAVLVPIFSGRECTFPFLALSVNFNPWDFLNAKERALTMQRSGSTSAPCKRVLAAAGIVSEEQSLDMLLSKEQKIHIDRIFALFLADFDLIGELEGYSHYWF
jgi:hypothetical protein